MPREVVERVRVLAEELVLALIRPVWLLAAELAQVSAQQQESRVPLVVPGQVP